METNQILKIGIFDPTFLESTSYSNSKEKVVEHLSHKHMRFGKIAVNLRIIL